MSGHWIGALDEKEAIDIAKRYKIGNPMGGETKNHRVNLGEFSSFSPDKKYMGKLWIEENGKLTSFETPLTEYAPEIINNLSFN